MVIEKKLLQAAWLLSFSVFRWYSKMSPEQVDSLAFDIEVNLKRDLVLVKGFSSKNLRNDGQAKKTFGCQNSVSLEHRKILSPEFNVFPSNQIFTSFKVIFVDTFFVFGSFGCLSNQMFLLGSAFELNFSYVMHEAKKNGQLQVISHIKKHRKLQLTPAETVKYAKYLKWMKTLRSFCIYMILPPVLLFVAVEGCLSSLEVQSMTCNVPTRGSYKFRGETN